MIKKIKQLTATLSAMLLLAFPVLAPVSVHAATIKDQVCSGVDKATGSDGDACSGDDASVDKSLNDLITLVIKYFSIIIGAVSVIMIIYGGFKYITSGGNDNNVSGAKNTILYAVIGLVIVALAQVVVRFVLTNASV